MLCFSALVYPDLANSPRQGPWNNKQPQTEVTAARGAVVASLCHPSLCHRCFTGLVLNWDIWEFMGSRAVPGVSVQVPSALGDRCWPVSALTLLARWSREIRSQQRRGCSFAICRRVCVSLKCWVSGRCPRHWEYWRVLSYWVMKGKGNFAGRWCLHSGLAGTQLQLQTSVGLVLPRFCMAEMSVCVETFAKTISEMWSCAKPCNTEMEQGGAFPFPTKACARRRSKVGDVRVLILWLYCG